MALSGRKRFVIGEDLECDCREIECEATSMWQVGGEKMNEAERYLINWCEENGFCM